MKKALKILATSLLAGVIFISAIPASALTFSGGEATRNVKMYSGGKSTYYTGYIYLSQDPEADETKLITLKSKKTTKKSVAKPYCYDVDTYEYQYFEYPETSTDYNYYINDAIVGPGKATVTYTFSDKTSLSTNYEVLKYENPIKSFKIAGVEVKNSFKKSNYYYNSKFQKSVKNQKFAVKAAKNWVITGFEVYGYNGSVDEGNSYKYGHACVDKTFYKKTTSFSYKVGNPSKYEDVTYYVYMKNTKTNATQTLTYEIDK